MRTAAADPRPPMSPNEVQPHRWVRCHRWIGRGRCGRCANRVEMEGPLPKPMAQAAHTSTLSFTPMANKLVNYATTPNGIAVIELASDAAGAPLKPGATGPNTYTHAMML